MPTTATPLILRDPGYLFWAPLGSSEPTNTVAGSKFTDSWPVAWLSLGATEDGSAFTYQSTLEAITVAEFFDPIVWATTERNGNFAFALADYTMKNLQRAFNGGGSTLVVVSGSGATQLTSLVAPAPGAEVRAMIGWESIDATLRVICYQTINGGEMKSELKKAPAKGLIPCQFNFEVPSSGLPFKMYGAGAARVGV